MMGFDPRLLRGTTWRWLMIAVLAGLGSLGLTIALYTGIGYLIDHLYSGTSVSAGFWIFLGSMIVGKTLLSWLEKTASLRTSSHTKIYVRDTMYSHALTLGPGLLDSRRTGELAGTATEGMEWLETFYGVYWVQFIVGMVTPVLLVAYLFTLDWVVALALLVSIPLTPAFLMLVQRRFKSVSDRYFTAANRLSDRFLDSLQGLPTLKMFTAAYRRGRRLAEETESLREETMRLLAVNQLALFIVDWGFALGTTAVVTLVAVVRIEAAALTLGTGITLVLLSLLATRPLNLIGAFFFAGAIGRSVAKTVGGFLDETPQISDNSETVQPEILRPGLQFRNVTFAYDKAAAQALNDVSFSIEPGERVALVGPSGAGKSTIMHLIFRFFDPDDGEILVDHHPIQQLPLRELRNRITLVSQHPYLFYGTVRENLTIADEHATKQEIEAAARAANIHEFVLGLPEGYDTTIGERGLTLSGGQAQRLAITRGLLKNAPLVLLDEPTSQIDSENEAVIQEALRQLTSNRTVLTIAHRRSTIRNADRVLVLSDGRLVESGTHESLMRKSGFYARQIHYEQERLEELAL